ncbi:hypothetical protein [Moraxella lacunata]|uniref:hypothetical protein n=1 Tax=Moraxella lacunata TaxID=477 RepID=UPI003EE283F7
MMTTIYTIKTHLSKDKTHYHHPINKHDDTRATELSVKAHHSKSNRFWLILKICIISSVTPSGL